MSGPLAGLRVVVTRPAAQAATLLAALAAEGADVLHLPTLAIERVELEPGERARLAPDGFALVIYTSVNAVQAALAEWPPPRRATLLAVGAATRAALQAAGLEATAPAGPGQANSEGLLALPELAAPLGQRILIVRGVGGRELLADTLRARGAELCSAELYRRVPLSPDPSLLERVLDDARARHPCVVAASSVEGLEALLAGREECVRDALCALPWLLPGQRVAAAARALGHRGPLVLADSAEVPAQVEALRRWRASGGGRDTRAC